MTPRKLIFKHMLSPGDVVVMTAAIRDLHASHPGSFLTDVRTPCNDVFRFNPHITPIEDDDPSAELMDLHYPAIHTSNQKPHHFMEGFRLYLEDQLNIRIQQGPFKPDIYIGEEEKKWMSAVEEQRGMGARFWIVVSGGKMDYTNKWWSPARWQEVVNHFQDRILFVQVGEKGHHHPDLENVLDLRGATDMRQLIRLVYHADGVICPVTSLMHLSAGVPTKDGNIRPCVVVAGGREPRQWEAYPGHRFLDTIGALDCCRNGGCWKSRVVPLGDGDDKDKSLCKYPTETDGVTIPKCLDMITARHVIEAIESYGVATTPTNVSMVTRQSEPDTTPATQRSPLPVPDAKGPVLYIWANHTHQGGHKIGDCIVNAYTSRLFAESKQWGRIVMSRVRGHTLNFVYDQFIRDYDVQVIEQDWPPLALGDVQCDAYVHPLCDELFEKREVEGIRFDDYRELYRRVMGGMRQMKLCGSEKGIGRRNIFEYLFFGQEWAPETCPRGADFRPSAYGWSWNPSVPERTVFVCPHAYSQTNDVFTLKFWAEVVRELVARGIRVTVNTEMVNWFGPPPKVEYYYAPHGDFEALAQTVAKQRLVLCGNTGVGWMAAAHGVPLISGEPAFFWFMDFRYRECGVPAQIFSEPDPHKVCNMVEARLIP